MSDYYGWAPYVPVAERRRRAEKAMEKQRKRGVPVSPVVISGRTIARSFWGRSWCDNLEAYSDFANRLPRGRTYVRNGSVIDLQIAPGLVRAQVSGSSIYQVRVEVKAVPGPRWRAMCEACGGAVASLVELLQGRFSQAVMERFCRQGEGLFPAPQEIRFSCSCPDGAYLCKHVAAVLYGIGSRLDAEPELLFLLRQVDGKELLAQAAAGMAPAPPEVEAGRVLEGEDLEDLFGLELGGAEPEAAVAPAAPMAPGKQAAPKARARKAPVRTGAERTGSPKAKAAEGAAPEATSGKRSAPGRPRRVETEPPEGKARSRRQTPAAGSKAAADKPREEPAKKRRKAPSKTRGRSGVIM